MVAYTPICQSIIMTGEALANAHKKFLSDYQATVGVGDIDEDEIQAEIDGYQELFRSLDDLIRTAKTSRPDLEQRSMRAYEAMQKRQEKLEKLRTYSALSASFFSEYESSQQELTNGLAQVKNCTAWNASTGTFDISKLNMNWAKDISTRWKNREVAIATQKEEAFNNNLKKLEGYTIYAWPYEDPVTGEVTVNWFIDKDGRRLDNSELQNFLEQHGTELDPSYYHIVDWKKIRDLENDALRRGETYITGQKYEGFSKGSMQLSGYISTGYAFAQDSGLYDLAMIAGLSYAGAKTKVSSPKKASGAGGTNKNVVSTLPEDGNSTVGRWMSNDEYNKMIDTGKVQMSPNGNRTYVASPASKDAFPSAPNGSIYSEFDVAKNSLYPAGNENWSQIPGPGSLIDRLNQKKGLPAITEMPDALNIKNLGGK